MFSNRSGAVQLGFVSKLVAEFLKHFELELVAERVKHFELKHIDENLDDFRYEATL